MNFKPSVILLLASILPFAVAQDKEYDYEILKTMLRSQTKCPDAYSAYVSNCTLNYNNDVSKCENDETAAELRLKEASVESRRKFILEANNACKAIDECETVDDNVSNTMGCIAQQSLVMSASMNNMYYEAGAKKNDYEKELQNIRNIKGSCTNATTFDLSSKINAAVLELNKCYATDDWELVEELHVVPEPTSTAPVVAVVSESLKGAN